MLLCTSLLLLVATYSFLLLIGIFIHYLTLSGRFQPGIEKAGKLPSLEMAKVMAKTHRGVVRQLNNRK